MYKLFHLGITAFVFLCFTFSLKTQAQNLVLNPGFEDGTPSPLCNHGNDTFYLGKKHCTHWDGEIVYVNPNGQSNYPDLTGTIYDKLSAPSSSCFAAFPNGMTSYRGNKSVLITLTRNGSIFQGNRAIGKLANPLVESCYDLCIKLSGKNPETNQDHLDNIVQVVLRSSAGSKPEKVVGEFNIKAVNGWKSFGKFFSIPHYEAGHYDKIVIRLKEDPNHLKHNHRNRVYIDEVSISRCGRDGIISGYTPDLKYNLSGDASFTDLNVTVNPGDAGALYGWQISSSNDLLDIDSSGWTVLPQHDLTSTDPSYSVSQLPANGKYYKLLFSYYTPCELVYADAVIFRVHSGPAKSAFVPNLTDIPGTNARPVAPTPPTHQGVLSTPEFEENAASEKLHFQISPNPVETYLQLNLSDELVKEKLSIIIPDSKGAEVLSKQKLTADGKVNVGELAGGIYYLRLSNGQQSEIQKFMKAE